MGSRLELHSELLSFASNVYFQPPENLQLKYPCIIYNKTGKDRKLANNGIYLSLQEYQMMVIDPNPDSEIANNVESYFTSCVISQYYTVDNLNHTTLTLYY